MQQKLRQTLQNERGVSLVIVLCIGALLIALSAAMMYGASLLTASANHQIQQEDVYQLAKTFGDQIEAQLTKEPLDLLEKNNNRSTTFAEFLQNSFLTSSYGPDADYTFLATNQQNDPDFGTIRLILRKEQMEPEAMESLTGDGDTVVQNIPNTFGNTNVSENSELKGKVYSKTKKDYLIVVTIEAEREGKKFRYTQYYVRNLECPVKYTITATKSTTQEVNHETYYRKYGASETMFFKPVSGSANPHELSQDPAITISSEYSKVEIEQSYDDVHASKATFERVYNNSTGNIDAEPTPTPTS